VVVENRIHALHAEGFSIREIARELHLSRMKVHRVLMASADDMTNSPSSPAVADDPVLSLLSGIVQR
jgi:orotate phosphoribosyltransferase-like protein